MDSALSSPKPHPSIHWSFWPKSLLHPSQHGGQHTLESAETQGPFPILGYPKNSLNPSAFCALSWHPHLALLQPLAATAQNQDTAAHTTSNGAPQSSLLCFHICIRELIFGKTLWHLDLPERIKVFLWKCLKGILAVKLRKDYLPAYITFRPFFLVKTPFAPLSLVRGCGRNNWTPLPAMSSHNWGLEWHPFPGRAGTHYWGFCL